MELYLHFHMSSWHAKSKFTFSVIKIIIREPCLFHAIYSRLIGLRWLKLYLSLRRLFYLTHGWNSYYLAIFEQQQLLYIPRSSSARSSWHVFDDVRALGSLAAGRGELRKPLRQTNFMFEPWNEFHEIYDVLNKKIQSTVG
jgi:hypothetical protein